MSQPSRSRKGLTHGASDFDTDLKMAVEIFPGAAEGAEALRLHPYHPLGVSIPDYAANTLSTVQILAIFSATCLSILAPTWFYAKRSRPDLATGQALTVLWFVLCGFIHLGLEGESSHRSSSVRKPRHASSPPGLGYFALHAHDIASRTGVLAQLWKEYSLSDSRYLTADTFVVCMETITAVFWGPLSLVCAWCIVADHPLRHPLQSIISLGQLYGDVLYYATCAFELATHGIEYSRPELAYFWGYFVLMNAFWIVIPLCLLVQSTRETSRAFAIAKRLEKASR